MTPTEKQILSLQDDWRIIAKEDVKVEFISGTYYGFCSELAALRLEHKYGTSSGKVAAGYSANLKSYYFKLETNL